jgi:uncharacterized protein (TIGR00156 family)
MKKMIAVALIAICSTGAFAKHDGFKGPTDQTTVSAQGGFIGPSAASYTVEQAKKLSDDAKVILKGNIVRHLGGKDYLFQDATGTITVEIGASKWNGLTVTPQDLVEISGEVDKDFTSIEIEVYQIKKVN